MIRILTILMALTIFALPATAQQPVLNVIASTTIIADIAQNVGGDLVRVTPLIPTDTDSHAFELRPADLVMIDEADLLLLNGGGLEGFLESVLENTQTRIVIAAQGVEVLTFHHQHEGDHEAHHAQSEPAGVLGQDIECDAHDHHEEATPAADEAAHAEDEHGECDPHFWGNPLNAAIYAQNIASAFAELDPAHAEIYAANADAYAAQMQQLDEQIAALVAGIPVEERIIVTNHEFLGYFAARYEFEIVGTVIPGVSTLAETNPRELADLQATIEQEGVRAIFAEISQTGQLAQVLAAELGSAVSVEYLYSESLSAADGLAATYIDYMLTNTNTIVAALETD
jgi:zinc/manganese transport system substrate-binding protein